MRNRNFSPFSDFQTIDEASDSRAVERFQEIFNQAFQGANSYLRSFSGLENIDLVGLSAFGGVNHKRSLTNSTNFEAKQPRRSLSSLEILAGQIMSESAAWLMRSSTKPTIKFLHQCRCSPEFSESQYELIESLTENLTRFLFNSASFGRDVALKIEVIPIVENVIKAANVILPACGIEPLTRRSEDAIDEIRERFGDDAIRNLPLPVIDEAIANNSNRRIFNKVTSQLIFIASSYIFGALLENRDLELEEGDEKKSPNLLEKIAVAAMTSVACAIIIFGYEHLKNIYCQSSAPEDEIRDLNFAQLPEQIRIEPLGDAEVAPLALEENPQALLSEPVANEALNLADNRDIQRDHQRDHIEISNNPTSWQLGQQGLVSDEGNGNFEIESEFVFGPASNQIVQTEARRPSSSTRSSTQLQVRDEVREV